MSELQVKPIFIKTLVENKSALLDSGSSFVQTKLVGDFCCSLQNRYIVLDHELRLNDTGGENEVS